MRKLGWKAAAGLALAVALSGASAIAQQSLPQKADSAIEKIEEGAAKAGQKLQEGFEKVRQKVHAMGVETRVYSRLHWDKDLTDASLDVRVEHDGIVTLVGTVKDDLAKAKAVALTENTVGVTQVVDHLTVSTTTAP